MALNPLRQYYAGGVGKQMMDGCSGGGTAFNQYAAGGSRGQLKQASGFAGTHDQYYAGGPVKQILDAGNVTPPPGPTYPVPGSTPWNQWTPGPTGG